MTRVPWRYLDGSHIRHAMRTRSGALCGQIVLPASLWLGDNSPAERAMVARLWACRPCVEAVAAARVRFWAHVSCAFVGTAASAVVVLAVVLLVADPDRWIRAVAVLPAGALVAVVAGLGLWATTRDAG